MFRIDVDDKAYKNLLKNLIPQFRQELSRQLLGFGRHAQRLVKDEVRGGQTPPPLGIQRIIKGHAHTLVETMTLGNSITWKYNFGSGRRFGGVEVKVDGPRKRIAAVLHEGTGPWVPDEYQRRAVYAKLEPGTHIGPKKRFWEIKPRPFMKNALDKEAVVRKFAQSVSRAINSTVRKYGKSGGGGGGGGGA